MSKYIKGKNFPKLFRGGRMMENLWPALLTRLANGINGGLIPWLKPTDGCMKCVIRTGDGIDAEDTTFDEWFKFRHTELIKDSEKLCRAGNGAADG